MYFDGGLRDRRIIAAISSRTPSSPLAVFGADLRAWYKSDDPAVVFASGKFATVPDASGNSNPLTGGGGANNPTIAAAPIGGHQSADFAPANVTFMNTPTPTHPGVIHPFGIFGIVRPRSNVTKDVVRFMLGGQGGAGMRVLDTGGVMSLSFYDGGPSDQAAVITPGQVCYFSGYSDGTDLTLRLNSGATTIGAAKAGGNTLLQSIIGTNGGFGANDSYDGAVLEWGIVDRLAAQSEDNALHAWMLSRTV